MKTIAVATDLSDRATHAVARAFALAESLDAALYVFSVVDDHLPEDLGTDLANRTQDMLAQFCAPHAERVRATPQVLRGPVDDALTAAVEAHGIDLMIVGLHRHRLLMDLVRETTMERLIRRLHIPVLVVQHGADAPYQSVLGAVDFAPASAEALRIARFLAPNAALHAVHAVHVPMHTPPAAIGAIEDFQTLVDPAAFFEQARHQKHAWLAQNPDLANTVDVALEEGSVHAVIGQARQKVAPDLIALGTHGRAMPLQWLTGSFANDMMRDPPTDLLIVPPRMEPKIS